jgi:hypothetical protein
VRAGFPSKAALRLARRYWHLGRRKGNLAGGRIVPGGNAANVNTRKSRTLVLRTSSALRCGGDRGPGSAGRKSSPALPALRLEISELNSETNQRSPSRKAQHNGASQFVMPALLLAVPCNT